MNVVGHRGAKGLAPENTLASFKKALECGVDEIELDARTTSDNIVILSHNAAITDDLLVVAEHTYKELLAAKPDLTTLDDAIGMVNRRVPIIIEVKPGVDSKPIIPIIRGYLDRGWQPTDLLIASYSQPILVSLHTVFPELQTIVIENWSGVRARHRARQLGTKRLSMLEYWLWSGFISAMSKRGYQIYSFPPKDALKEQFWAKFGLAGHTNNPAKAAKWARYGLAGVITDFPDRYKK